MKKSILLLATVAVLAPCLPVATRGATQVYDLKNDWSNTQNPNGSWSYCFAGDGLLPNDSFAWGILDELGYGDAVRKTTAVSAAPGYLEIGDISVISYSGVGVRWIAPANGTISVSGTIWNAIPDSGTFGAWTLARNGSVLSDGYWGGLPRSSPDDLSLGSAGPSGLLNVPVQASDWVELEFIDYHFFAPSQFGINFTITLTTDSVDPVAAVEALATTVIEMNLQNGIANSLDSKLDAALNVLLDVNVSNDGAACNSLQAFISSVEAQRGKKITSNQADQLIASAQEIKAILNCAS
jgi:hypothetical protein